MCSVAVCEGGTILGEHLLYFRRRHSEELLSMVDALLRETELTLADMDALVVGIGPGSFTGLRVGTATWKGLALGADKPLVGVPSLDAMARAFPAEGVLVCPMLDARMDEVFGAAYRFTHGVRETVCEACVAPVEAFLPGLDGPVVCFGDGVSRYEERLLSARPDARILEGGAFGPRASAVAFEGMELLGGGAEGDAGLVAPVYLRKSQAEQSRAKVES